MTQPFYVISIFDNDDPHGTTVHSFAEPRIWEWLHQHEPFPAGESCQWIRVPLSEAQIEITQWDPTLDKAQNLAAQPHQLLTRHQLGRHDSARFAEAYAALTLRAGTLHVYEGAW